MAISSDYNTEGCKKLQKNKIVLYSTIVGSSKNVAGWLGSAGTNFWERFQICAFFAFWVRVVRCGIIITKKTLFDILKFF